MNTLSQLEDFLSRPSQRLIDDIAQLTGDILVLGAGGKMGPSLCKLAKNAIDAAGINKRVIAVSRFSSAGLAEELQAHGIETIAADLLDEAALAALPLVPNVIYMAGRKFGTAGNQAMTWAMNTYLAGRVGEKYCKSRIVAFSTGNVYPLTSVATGGADEQIAPDPVGEYAQSCLGRERMFEYVAHRHQTPVVLFRLNYAIDMRYGVLLEIVKSIRDERVINLKMGHVNVIWQGDANEYALRSLLHCTSPPLPLNITGPETISIRWMAEKMGEMMGKKPIFEYEPEPTALLNNASLAHRLFGYPSVPLNQLIEWTVQWVQQGGEEWEKATHFQERKGKF